MSVEKPPTLWPSCTRQNILEHKNDSNQSQGVSVENLNYSFIIRMH